MNWPTGPPPMPSPGWYSDPDDDSAWRWWDGTSWTERRSPKWVRPTPGAPLPPSLSRWFDRLVRCVTWVVRRVGLVVMGAWIVVGSMAVVVAVAAIESDRGRELRRLLDDGDLTTSNGLTDAEADRAWELFVSLFWSVLPWAIVIFVLYVLVTAWATALVAQVAATAPEDTAPADESLPTVRSALRRAPAVIGAWLVLVLIGICVVAAVSLPVVLLAIGDAGGAAIGLTIFFCVIAGIVVGAWLWVRLGLTVVLAALGGHGSGITQSWTLTHGRYWFVFVRLLLASLIAAAIGVATNVIVNVSSLFGVGVAAVLLLVLTVVAEVVRTIVTASAHVVIVEQIDEANRSTGSSVPAGRT